MGSRFVHDRLNPTMSPCCLDPWIHIAFDMVLVIPITNRA